MMSKYRQYCQFCGARIPKTSVAFGVYSTSCPEPSCPEHDHDLDNEYEGLTIFTPEDDND